MKGGRGAAGGGPWDWSELLRRVGMQRTQGSGVRGPGWIYGAVATALAGVAGCGAPAGPAGTEAARLGAGRSAPLEEGEGGAVAGRVIWEGELPRVAPFRYGVGPPPAGSGVGKAENPNDPRVDARDRGVGRAVVFLRVVDPGYAERWSQTPVQVEVRGFQVHVRQGGAESSFGFVRTGDEVEVVSRDACFHALRGHGGAYFGLALPEAGRARRWRLREKGIVELTSGTGFYWMRAYLFVDDHSYYARTDGHGNFMLRGVPPGDHELVCWVPTWREERHERDPESGFVSRLVFRPPVEERRKVRVRGGAVSQVDFSLAEERFR